MRVECQRRSRDALGKDKARALECDRRGHDSRYCRLALGRVDDRRVDPGNVSGEDISGYGRALGALCLVQFNEDPERDQKFETLKKNSFWQRRGYVEAQGWATLSGENEPDSPVAIACVNRIMKTSR